MARIFVSYSQSDKRIVKQYVDELAALGHSIFMDETLLNVGDNMPEGLIKAMRESDGTLVFLTTNSIESKNVIAELGMARGLWDSDRKFIIPVVKGKFDLPYLIASFQHIQIENKTVKEMVKRIDETIRYRMNSHVSNEIISIQNQLAGLGFYSGPKDGIMGPALRDAIRRFQASNNLEITGEWDDRTSIKANPPNTAATSSQSKTPDEPARTPQNYWLLAIYADNWKPEEMTLGSECYYNSYYNSKQPRSDIDNFRTIKAGDKGIAYDYSSLHAIVFLFEVTKELHVDPKRKEIFTFRITHSITPALSLKGTSLETRFNESFYDSTDERLFRITKGEFNAILTLTESVTTSQSSGTAIQASRAYIPEVFADSPAKEIKDQLGFESDINALAAVIAYQKVIPPLAIGLFGNWGSGKSFFMNKLQQRIGELALEDGDIFCKKVIHVNFNSWHYSDSNLWASLVTKLFDELQIQSKKNEQNIDGLFSKLNSTQELIGEKKQQQAAIENEIIALGKRQEDLDTEIKTRTANLNNLTPDSIAQKVWKNKKVQEKTQELKQAYNFLNIDEYGQIKLQLAELGTGFKRTWKSLQLLYSFRKGNSRWALAIALFIIVAFSILIYYADDLRIHIGKIKMIVAAAAVFLAQAIAFLKPRFRQVNKMHALLMSLEETRKAVEEEERAKFNVDKQKLQTELDTALTVQKELRLQVEQLTSRKEQLKIEIEEIATGKKIIRFIESRVTDQRYINSLGIISWIRKDFEQLGVLFKEQAETIAKLDQLQQKTDTQFQADRIILYIDDLDRCETNIVVNVLEAINLLLAFPLFVVIVGVDPRWMHRALTDKYQKYLNKENQPGKGDIPPALFNELGHPATSFDYLEKIFQIPFVLKPMNAAGKHNLIQDQLAIKTNEYLPPATGTATDPGGGEDADFPPDIIISDPIPPSTPVAPPPQPVGPTAIEPAKLVLSTGEIEFMKAISFLIGDSPRTVKRYINIYRIIRTHAEFRYANSNELEHYYAAMLMLGIITGHASQANDFFKAIKQTADNDTFESFFRPMGVVDKTFEFANELEKNIQTNTILQPLNKIRMEAFKLNLILISRFSFRNIDVR